MKYNNPNLISEELYRYATDHVGYGSCGSYDQEQMRTWLRKQKIFINVIPVDSWDSWHYFIYAEDIMSPLFECTKNKDNEFSTYEDALEHGLWEAIESLKQ